VAPAIIRAQKGKKMKEGKHQYIVQDVEALFRF
jgi:hypothetical protein